MAIITKPAGGILKGVPASISLSKSELSALSIIVADSYFSNMTNWNKVILKYRSSTGKQYEAVQFDATLSSPTGNFLVSIKARDAFEIQTIEIHDFDNDIFIVPRSALNVADFDIVLLTAPSSLSYSTPVMYTENTAITNNVPAVTGTVTSYSILPALPAGLSLDPVTGVISGTPTEVSAAANYVVTASNGAGSTTATINITVESAEEFTGEPISWNNASSGYLIELDGGVTTTAQRPSGPLYDTVYGSSNSYVTGDFIYEAEISTSLQSDSIVGFYDSITSPVYNTMVKGGATTLNFWLTNNWNNGTPEYTIAKPSGDTFLFKITRVGTLVKLFVNNVEIASETTILSHLSVPFFTLRPNDYIVDAQITFEEVPVGDPILWQSKPGYIIEADGGATATSERPNYGEYYRVFAPSSQWVTGDFTFEAEINNAWGGNDYIGFYDSDTNFTMTTGFNGSQVRYEQSAPASYVKPAGDTYTLKMQRIGYVLKFYVNDVEVYSVTQANLSTVKVPFFTFTDSTKHIVSATLLLPEANYYLYNQIAPVHTTNQFGAISSTGIGSSYNTTPLTGNFDITFNFDAAVTGQDSIFGVKQTVDTTDNYYGFRLYNGFHSYFSGQVRDIITQNSGANNYRITRTGSTIDFYANGVKLAQSASYSEPLYLVARGYNTFNLISTVDNLGTGSNFVPVTWNVAGKTGVGTVTTGANGLITRSDAGGAYNLNVLSNETITGDGYVEFVIPPTPSFTSVVFGLAEVNSPTGSFNNLLIGCYLVTNPGALEGVITTGNLTVNYGNFLNIGTAQTGNVIKIARVGTTYSIQINNGAVYSTTINNTNPLKVSISPYFINSGVENVTISL